MVDVARDVAVEVVSAVQRGLGLPAGQTLSPAALLGVLRHEKFPLLWLVPREAGEHTPGLRTGDHPADRSLLLLCADEFRAALSEDQARYAQLHGEYVRLAQAWAHAGVRSLCFKSAGISPPFPYAGDDVDILVPASSVEDARRVLMTLGYIEMTSTTDPLAWQFRRFVAGRAATSSIHLHARVGWDDGFLLEDDLWARARQAPDDPWTWVPGREDVVLINIAYALLQKRRLGLRSLIRIRSALSAGDIDWEYLEHVASERGWRDCFHLGMMLVTWLEEQLWHSSGVPAQQRERYEETVRARRWLARYGDRVQARPPTLPIEVPATVSKLLLFGQLWGDRHLPVGQKAARTMQQGIQRLRQKSGLHRQKAMLITLSGLDGGGKSTQAQLLRDAFAASHVRSQIVWMRAGHTPTLRILRAMRKPRRQHKGPANDQAASASRISRTGSGWGLAAWVIVACIDYVAWLQYVRWLLWRGDVVIADRYLCDFEVELVLRLKHEPHLAEALVSSLERLAPEASRSYLLRVDPQLSLVRKPIPDFRGLDPADLYVSYDALARRSKLLVFEGSQPVEEVADAIIHDVLADYMRNGGSRKDGAVSLFSRVVARLSDGRPWRGSPTGS